MKTKTQLISILLVLISFSAAAAKFDIKHWQTKKGTAVTFYKTSAVPMLDIRVAFGAGSARDGEHYGISSFTAEMLNQGNGGVNASEIAEKLADTGAQYTSETNRDIAVFSLRTLTEPQALKAALHYFDLIVSKPDFPSDAFARIKNSQQNAIEQSKESPDRVASLSFFEVLYKDHPYAHPILGTKESLNLITEAALKQFYKEHYTAKNGLVIIVGDISEKKAHKIAEQLTKHLPEGQILSPTPKALETLKGQTINIPFPSSQTILMLGQVAINHDDPNYFPLIVGNYILGGGTLVSRLAIEVREKKGFTYGVTSQFVPMPGNGPFIINLATKSNQAKEALSLTEEVVDQFVYKGPDEAELNAAKQYLTGSFPLSLASNSSIANLLLKMSFYHLPDDYLETYLDKINAVTVADIARAFKTALHPKKFLIVKTGQM